MHGGAVAGIAGTLLLAAYLGAPAAAGWPYAGAFPEALTAYARSHAILFDVGGGLQATGALLSILFFMALLRLSRRTDHPAAIVVYVVGAVLLAVVLIEAALLGALPMAAADGDRIIVATTFALSNGVFARIFRLAPAPMLFAGIGFTLRGTALLPAGLVTAALVIAALFVLAGVAAIFGTAGLILAIALSIVEAVWILSAGVALAMRTRR